MSEDTTTNSASSLDVTKDAFSAVPAAVMVADKAFNIVSVNAAMQKLLQDAEVDLRVALPNFSAELVVGSSLDQFFDGPEQHRRALERLTRPHNLQIKLGRRTFATTTVVMKNGGDENRGYVVQWEDLTMKLRVERARSQVFEENERVRAAVDTLPSHVMLADPDFTIIYINFSMEQLLRTAESEIRKDLPNFSADNLVGVNMDAFHKDPSHQRGLLRRLQAPHHGQIKLGNYIFDIVVSPIKKVDGTFVGYSITWEDVTDEVQLTKSQAQAASENERLALVLENITSTVILADTNFKIVYVNKAAKKTFSRLEVEIRKLVPGFTADNVIGHSLNEFNPDSQGDALQVISNLVEGSSHKGQISFGPVTFNFIITPAVGADGETLGYATQWTDISEQLETERQISRVVESAAQGRLDVRIDSIRATGFIAAFAENVNSLLNSISQPISDVSRVITELGAGNLRVEVGQGYPGDFAKIREELSAALFNLNDVLNQAKSVVLEVSHAAGELLNSSHEMAMASRDVGAAAVELTSALDQNAELSRGTAENANLANQLVSDTAAAAADGQEKMKSMQSSMIAISRSSDEIAKIIRVIDEIAFQTNLLALNAAVEAARAGKYGRGFAVVAQEVRNLAVRSAKAAQNTASLIDDSVRTVREGVSISESTGEAFEGIVRNVAKVKDLVSNIATASEDQTRRIGEIGKAMTQVTMSAQSTSEHSSDLAVSSEKLNQQTEILQDALDRFELAEIEEGVLPGFELPPGITQEMVNQLLAVLKASPQLGGDAAHRSESKASTSSDFEADVSLLLPRDSEEE